MGAAWGRMKGAIEGSWEFRPGEGIGLGNFERWIGRRWRAGEGLLMEVGSAGDAATPVSRSVGFAGGSLMENGKRPSML